MSEPTTQKQRDERATSERSVLDQIAERSLATRIVRWREGRVIGGVARGIAGRYDIDPVLVRVAFAVTAFIGGFGLAAYLLAWVLLPDEDGAVPLVQAAREKSAGPLALVVLAALVAAGTLFDSNDNGGGLRFLGLIALAVAGWWFWRRADGRDGGGRDEGADPAAASAPSVGTGADGVAPPAEPTQDAPVAATMPVITPWGGPDGERVATYGAGTHPSAYAAAPQAARVLVPKEPRRPRRRGLGWRGWLVALGWLILAATLANGLGLSGQVAVGATALGLGLLVVAAGLRGYRTSGIGVLAGLLAVGALLAPLESSSPHERHTSMTWAPASAADLGGDYQLGVGEAKLDLTGLSAAELGGRSIRLNAGVGEMRVRVPADVRLDVRPQVGLGEVRVEDVDGTVHVRSGAGIDGEGMTFGTGPTLTLHVEVGLGEARIERIAR